MEYEGDSDTNCNPSTWNNLQSIGKGSGKIGNKSTSGDYPYYSIMKYYTEKSSRDLRRLGYHSNSSEKALVNVGEKYSQE